MGKADYFRSGEWNFFCDLCGAKNKSSDAMKTWQGLRVCRHHKEVRNPQDFLRGVKDNQTVPWSRPEKIPETFVPQLCTLKGRNSVPGWAVPTCATPNFVNLSFLPSDPDPSQGPSCTLGSLNGIPSIGYPGCAIPSYNNLQLEETPPLDAYEGIQ